jgi:hypothetical protein
VMQGIHRTLRRSLLRFRAQGRERSSIQEFESA